MPFDGPNSSTLATDWSGISSRRAQTRERGAVRLARSATGSISHTSASSHTTRVLARDKFYLLSRTRSFAPLISYVRDQRRGGPFASRGAVAQSAAGTAGRSSYFRKPARTFRYVRTTGFVGSCLLRGYKSAAVRTSLTVPFTKNQPADTAHVRPVN